MTENLIVPSPPGLQQLPSNATSAPIHESGDSSGEIQCICEYTEDDGFTICCDGCKMWQHVACMQLREDDLPKQYLCSNCSPRAVDARKARELQRQLRRDEKNNRRKRPSTTYKKKEFQPGGTNGTAPGTAPSGLERVGIAKLPSPREPQPPTSRKRTQRTSHSHHGVNGGANSGNHATIGSGTHSPVYLPDRNGDVESDTDLDKYTYEFLYTPQNMYANEDVKSFLSTMNEGSSMHYTQKDLASFFFPKASVQVLPDSSKLYSEHSRWCFVLETPCPKGKPVALFKGVVGFQEIYKNEPINQYGLWHHPKPYVIFHPELPIYIDARQYGSDARFVRRSCRPNLDVRTIFADNSEVYFGLFASESIKPGTELTIGWDWNGSTQMQHIVDGGGDLSRLTTDEIKQATLWVDNLVEKMGDCACPGPPDCMLSKIRNSGDVLDSVATKRPVTNGSGKKHRIKRNPSTGSTASKEPTPDLSTAQPNDEDDDSKASVKVKSRSRDLTPLLAQDTAVELGTMTGREARKFKDVLSQIEKQTQDQQGQPNKRRKRNSTASLPMGTTRSASPGSENARGIDESRKQKSRKTESPATSPGSNAREVSVVDASTGRSPDFSVGFMDHRSHYSGTLSKSPVTSSTSSKVRRKVKTRTPKPNYVDSSTQTDLDDELPWWKQPVHCTPPRPPRLPLRKRLMQSLLQDREAAASAVSTQDKKRKHDCFAEDTIVSLQHTKIAKTEDTTGKVGVAEVTVVPSQKLTSIPGSLSNHNPPAVEGSTSLPPSDSGPALRDLFADSERPRGIANRTRPQQPHGNAKAVETSLINGSRPSGLNLQVPSTNLSNGLVPPGQASPVTGLAHTPISSSAAFAFSPSVMASVVNSATIQASPSPTKTKKLSLEDYCRRIVPKSVETGPPEKKEEETTALKNILSADPAKQLAFLNVLASPGDALPAPTSPQVTSVDSKIISARSGGVR